MVFTARGSSNSFNEYGHKLRPHYISANGNSYYGDEINQDPSCKLCRARHRPLQVLHSPLWIHLKSFNVIRYTYGEAFENIAQPTPRPLYSVSSASPLLSSWHTFSETGSVLDTSTAGSRNSEQPACTNLAHDFARHGNYYNGTGPVSYSGRYDGRALNQPLDPPSESASSQFTNPRDKVDQHPRTEAHPVMFTDDAGLRLCDRLRRRCFNCKTTTTTTWRRSTLNPGKLVCSYIVVEMTCLR